MARTARSDTPPNTRAKLFTNGGSQAVRLPQEFRFEGKEVAIRKEGDAVILEPVGKLKSPAGYWQRIDRRAKDLDLGRVVPIGGDLLDLAADQRPYPRSARPPACCALPWRNSGTAQRRAPIPSGSVRRGQPCWRALPGCRVRSWRSGAPRAAIGEHDLLIASIALASDLTLVTHNATEFSRVPKLRVEDWTAS